ncbi:MAG: hypothetical protein HY811_02465 [Planctomycetes bacterium]|nr:hypothetical protein [Planctomycetota bacterium]
MGKRMLIIAVFGCLLAFAGIVRGEEKDIQEKSKSLREEISLTNLINGLNLTEEQFGKIINVLKELDELRESYKEKGEIVAADLEKSLDELKKDLITHGSNISPETGSKANATVDKAEELQEEFKVKQAAYQSKIEEILTEAQKEVINTFKPCLLPPKSQKNPVRAGQASSNEREIAILRKIRSVRAAVYEEKRKKILEEQFKKFEEKHGKLTDEEKAKEEARLFGLVDEARGMSDEEFELNKDELASQFLIKNKAEELSEQLKEITEYRNQGKPKLDRIGRFFLNPKMLGILEAKLIVVKNFTPPPAKDLDDPGLGGQDDSNAKNRKKK